MPPAPPPFRHPAARAVLWVAVALSTGCSTKRGADGRAIDAGAASGSGALDPASPEAVLARAAAGEEPLDPLADPAADPTCRSVPRGPEEDDPNVRRRTRREEDDLFFEAKFEAARDEASVGSDAAAIELLTAALKLDPKPPWDARFKALRAEIKARHLETEILRVDVRPVRDYVPFDAAVDLIVRLRNVGKAEVVILPPTSGPDAISGSSLVLTVKRTDHDIYEAELSRTWTKVVPLLAEGAEELRIPSETVHEVRVRVPPEDVGGAVSGLRVLELSGDLRAGRIEAGISEPLGRVPIRPGRVVVLPGNFEPLAADPLGSLRKAAEVTAPVHLLVASEFVPPESRPEALRILAAALATGPAELHPAAWSAIHLIRRAAAGTPVREMARPLMEALDAHPERATELMDALRALTLVSLAPDARLWDDWWRRELAGPGAVVKAQDDPDETARREARLPR